MYKELIEKIEATLKKVKAIKKVYPYPLGESQKITANPAAIFFPSTAENRFETNADNFKEYRFKLYLVVSYTTSAENIWTEVLPNVVDQVIAQFDADWDMSIIGSSRSWVLIDSGTWTSVVTDKGQEAIADLDIRVRLLSSL